MSSLYVYSYRRGFTKNPTKDYDLLFNLKEKGSLYGFITFKPITLDNHKFNSNNLSPWLRTLINPIPVSLLKFNSQVTSSPYFLQPRIKLVPLNLFTYDLMRLSLKRGAIDLSMGATSGLLTP